jgi:hypothetical protein
VTAVQKALERALDAWKALDRDAYADAFAPRFTCVHPFGTDTTADDVRKHVDDTKKFWSQCDYRIEKVVGDDQHGAVHYVASMTPRGSDDSVDVPITSMIDIEDGLITYWLEVFDSVTMRTALKQGQKAET